MGNLLCMGLILRFRSLPPPGVPTTPTTACPPEWTWTCSTVTFCWPLPRCRLRASSQRGVGAGKACCLCEVLASALEGLLADHGVPVAFHCGVMAAISAPPSCPRAHPWGRCRSARATVALYCLSRSSGLEFFSQRPERLIGENVVPMVATRAADTLQLSLQIAGIMTSSVWGSFFLVVVLPLIDVPLVVTPMASAHRRLCLPATPASFQADARPP